MKPLLDYFAAPRRGWLSHWLESEVTPGFVICLVVWMLAFIAGVACAALFLERL